MVAKVTFTRNWNTVGHLFEFTIPDRLEEEIANAVDRAAEIYTESILDVVAEQPSDWTPKSADWTKRSGSSDLYYGKTGQFVVAVASAGKNTRGIRAKRGDKRVFVGARHDVKHHSGFSMEQLAGLLNATPDGSRDLFRRAFDRVESQIDMIFERIGTFLK